MTQRYPLVLNGTTIQELQSGDSIPADAVALITPQKGGTGIANGSNNTLTYTGNYSLGVTLTGNTTVTLPTSGTLATTAQITGVNSGTNTGDNAVNTLYSGLVTNATHTGDATGATALTVKGINGTLLSGLATGILKNTTTTGVPSIAIAADFPTLNQSTTGTAAKATILETTRAIYGSNFDGSAALTGIIASTYGGTGNGFTKFTGPTTSEKTFTLPNSSETLLYSGGALGTPASGTLTNCTFPTLNQSTSGTAAKATILETTRAIYGNNFDGSAAVTGIIASTYGGTGNGFTKFSGATTAEKTYTLPDANATILYSGGALGTPSGGTLTNCTFPTLNQNTSGTAAGLSATLAVTLGGTGLTALGTPGYVLRTNVGGTAMEWFSPAAGGTVTSVDGSGGTTGLTLTGGAITAAGTLTLGGLLVSANGGTGNGFTKFTGPATAEKTFTLPNSSETLLYSGGALGTPSSGTVTNLTGTASININGTVGATTATTGTFTTATATHLDATTESLGMQSIATSGGTTTFTATSPYYTIFTGTQGQTLVLPNATTLKVGWKYGIDNDSTQAITVNANGGGAFWIIAPGCDLYITCTGIGSAAGTWEKDYSAAKAANGKSLTISNTLTLTGTDASSVAFGAGGTVLYNAGALGTPGSGNLVNCTGIPESGFKNIIINGGFTVNQRVYASGATLAAGAYGHDRWKAGSGGGDYSFTQLASNTTITIAANKTLIQVIEDKNVHRTSYTLSWTGTAQARYAVNSATPAGAYAASPIVITGQTVGTTMSVEFPFRSFASELALCQRYFFKTCPQTVKPGSGGVEGTIEYVSTVAGAIYDGATVIYPVSMRVDPTLTLYGPTGSGAAWFNNSRSANSGAGAVGANHSERGTFIVNNPQDASDAANQTLLIHMTAAAEL